MLTYFPTPYPDEWWYSVIGRYYVRNGISSPVRFLKKFYEENSCTPLGILFPGSDCYTIVSQLPEDVFSLKKILLEHTLLPYYLRFYSIEKKREILEKYLNGETYSPQRIKQYTLDNKQGIRFCPICYAQDTVQYGEPYWHREHQMPLVSACLKHGCQLCMVKTKLARLTRNILPLCQIQNTDKEAQVCRADTEAAVLSRFAYALLVLPFETAVPKNNCLKEAIQSSEFASYDIQGNVVLDAIKLRQRCAAVYGKTEKGRYWDDITPYGLARICSWSSTVSPELYICLSVLFGLTAGDLFCLPTETNLTAPNLEQVLPDSMEETDRTEEVKPQNVTPRQTTEPIRKKNAGGAVQRKNRREKSEHLGLFFTDEEWHSLVTTASISGNEGPAAFARAALLQETKQTFDEMEGEIE